MFLLAAILTPERAAVTPQDGPSVIRGSLAATDGLGVRQDAARSALAARRLIKPSEAREAPVALLGVPEPSSPSARPTADAGSVMAAVRAAAAEFGQDPEEALQVVACESSYHINAVGKVGERGLWQFLPATWERNAARLGYSEDEVWDAVVSSRVAMEMWSRGQSYQWSCWRAAHAGG